MYLLGARLPHRLLANMRFCRLWLEIFGVSTARKNKSDNENDTSAARHPKNVGQPFVNTQIFSPKRKRPEGNIKLTNSRG
jgi:hypothetical protein